MKIEVVGFDVLKSLYPKDTNFAEAWKACLEPVTLDRIKWLEFIIQEGMLFRESQLCISRSSMRENLIKEKHSGGLAIHFGRDKTISIVGENYY